MAACVACEMIPATKRRRALSSTAGSACVVGANGFTSIGVWPPGTATLMGDDIATGENPIEAGQDDRESAVKMHEAVGAARSGFVSSNSIIVPRRCHSVC